jgi:hypothetical protein
MQKPRAKTKYTELANSGKWIALARAWLNDNAPCSREKYFVELGMLMPSTVRGTKNKLLLPQSLLRRAYYSIYGSLIIPETIVCLPSIEKKAKGTTVKILDALREGRTICKEDFPESKCFQRLISRAVKKQAIQVEQVTKGKYRLKEASK